MTGGARTMAAMSPRRAAAQADGKSLEDLLIEACEKIIATDGTATLTVRAIARTAGVADGVLYNHFSDKEELVARALLRFVRRMEEGLGELPVAGEGTVAGNLHRHLEFGLALHHMIVPAFSGLLGQPKVLRKFAEITESSSLWRDRLRTYLAGERELGRLRPESEVDAAAALLVGHCHATVLGRLFPHAEAGAAPSTESIVKTVLAGIAP